MRNPTQYPNFVSSGRQGASGKKPRRRPSLISEKPIERPAARPEKKSELPARCSSSRPSLYTAS